MKRLPYGITDYKSLIEENYYYVDKTRYLEELEKDDEVLIYLRPRRFGKTLFTSMMSYYYDINAKNEFDCLFKDTYIHDNPTPKKNKYYIFKMDFSGIGSNNATEEEIKKSFNNSVKSSISTFISHYGLDLNIDMDESNPASLALDFFTAFNNLNLDNKLYVIIDEYDNFTNTILGNNKNLFEKLLTNDGFVKAFYQELKKARGTVIGRIFITGVCSISLDAMSSGFNIGTNITNQSRFNAMTALTYEEVKEIINQMDINDKEEIFDTLALNYDGYKFNRKVDYKVFNTTLVMYYLNNIIKNGEQPDELLDVNIVSNNFDQINTLINLVSDKEKEEMIKALYFDNCINTILKNDFDINNISIYDILSLLYYFGYLTIEDYDINMGTFTLRKPNKVMEELYSRLFIRLTNKNVEIDRLLNEAIIAIKETGDIKPLTNIVSETVSYLSYRDYQNFDEKYIKIIYFTMLKLYRDLKVYSEKEVKEGFTDLFIERNSESAKYNILIELKYLKKEEKDNLSKYLEEGKLQLERYITDKRIDKDNLRKYVIVFVNDEYTLEEIL